MNQKQQTGIQLGSPQRIQEVPNFGQSKRQEPTEAERKDLTAFSNRGEKKFANDASDQNNNTNSERYGTYNYLPRPNDQPENNYFEKFFGYQKSNVEIQQNAEFGIPLHRLSLKDDERLEPEGQFFKIPPFEENKQGNTPDQQQYSYLSKPYQEFPFEKSGGFESNQGLVGKIDTQALPGQFYPDKPSKSASDEKILKKFMSKVTGLPNTQLPMQFSGSLTDIRPATTKPSFKNVWKYRPNSQVKPFETLIGPDEEDEDAEDDEDYVATHNYRRSKVSELSQNNQVIVTAPKILAKNPFVLNTQEHDVYVDGSDKHDDLESEESTAKSFSGNQNNRSSMHHTSGEVWENNTPITTPRPHQRMVSYQSEPNLNFITQQLQDGLLESNKSGLSGVYENARRTSNQLSNDSINRSYEGWNLKHTPTRPNNQLIKKPSLSFISSESIDSDNFNNFDQMNNSFNTHFRTNSNSFHNPKPNEFNSPSRLEISSNQKPPQNLQYNEYSQANLQQQLIGFNNPLNLNPLIPKQVIQEPHQQNQQVLSRPQQQQQIQYQNYQRGGYNLNQSAILFGNTTSSSFNQQIMQPNWNMNYQQQQQMDQMNRSFNVLAPSTGRDNSMYGTHQNFNLNHSMILPRKSSFQEQNFPNTQRIEPDQKVNSIGSHQKIKGKGSKKGKDGEDTSKEFEIDLRNIEQVSKTTLMIRNIPNKYDQNLLLQTINRNHKGKFDFLYLPIDFKNKCNVGYAFINFIKNIDIRAFYMEFNGKRWDKFNSEKISQINYARIQGLKQLVHHFKSSNVMNQQDKKLKPVILTTSTRQAGTEIIQNIQSIEELIKQQKATLNTNNPQ